MKPYLFRKCDKCHSQNKAENKKCWQCGAHLPRRKQKNVNSLADVQLAFGFGKRVNRSNYGNYRYK